jgi:hypothetical protein
MSFPYPHWKKNEIARPVSYGFYWIILTLLTLYLLIGLIPPVSAGYSITGSFLDISQTINEPSTSHFVYTADPDEKFVKVEFDVPINTLVNFTLNYGESSSVDGSIEYVPYLVVGKSTSTLMLGSDVKTENFIDAQAFGYAAFRHIILQGYARNESGTSISDVGFVVYDRGYGTYSNMIVYYPVTNLPNNLIYGISVSSTQDITIEIQTSKTEDLFKYVSATLPENFDVVFTKQISELSALVSLLWGIFLSLFFWFNFIFVDNLLLTVCLYFGVTMAYSAMQSNGNIFAFYRRFFKLQKTFYEFAINSINGLVQMITAVFNALKPI